MMIPAVFFKADTVLQPVSVNSQESLLHLAQKYGRVGINIRQHYQLL